MTHSCIIHLSLPGAQFTHSFLKQYHSQVYKMTFFLQQTWRRVFNCTNSVCALMNFGCVCVCGVCVLLCSPAQIGEKARVLAPLKWYRVIHSKRQSESQSGYEKGRWLSYLSCWHCEHFSAKSFLEKAQQRAKGHFSPRSRRSGVLIMAQSSSAGPSFDHDKCAKREDMYSIPPRVSPCAAQQLILKFVFYLT